MIKLDIISDPICPWCYIGKARLNQALEQEGDHPFDIDWRPFQLNPTMPEEGMDRREYLEWKFGKENAVKFYLQIEEAADAIGLKVDFGKIGRTPNTIDAHRLIRWARLEDVQTPLVNALFHRYFSDGEDISQHSVLIDAANEVGMDAELAARLLKTTNDVDDIRAEDAAFREMGVQGVPCFVIGGRYVVNGAQEADMWSRVLADIKTQQKETLPSSGN